MTTSALPEAPFHAIESLLFATLVQLMIIILAARVMGHLAQRLRHPRAVGEIVAGLLLGPSGLGLLWPDLFSQLFRSHDATPLTVMSQIGLILLMFQVGMEFDFATLKHRQHRIAAVWITVLGMAVPFALGFGFGQISHASLAPSVPALAYSLFIAVAFSITAVPILGRILIEFGLTQTPLGVLTISAAAANDAIGWILLTVIATIAAGSHDFEMILRHTGWLILYLALAWVLVRPMIARALDAHALKSGELSQQGLAGLLLLVFGSALITSQLGIFAIFGGFVAGVLLHDRRDVLRAWNARTQDLISVFFLPIFFTYTGLRTDIGSLNGESLWAWCGLLLILAMGGKFIACYWAARWAGLNRFEARCIGILMNTRALMELIVINLGRDMGIIPGSLFTMLVIMAILSTLLTAPGLRLWLPHTGIRPSSG